MRSNRTHLVFFAAATVLLLLNYPWLSLFSSPHLLFDIPPLILYLFGLWLAFILIIRVIISHRPDDENQDPKPSSLASKETPDA